MPAKFAGARWALLKNPGTLTKRQELALLAVKRRGGALWRAYEMKESLRAIFAGDLEIDEVNEMLNHWCKRASRSRLPSFVRLLGDHPNSSRRDTCLHQTAGSNGRVEGL
ncbi:transposase [Ferrimicrobium sp.]|uniref:transposase n=1 Tax=Ferrimicrobium sp. TaxID=2926050 RepID=UPI002632CDCA|nr:transposase [Ferrimicrobium sp.]